MERKSVNEIGISNGALKKCFFSWHQFLQFSKRTNLYSFRIIGKFRAGLLSSYYNR